MSSVTPPRAKVDVPLAYGQRSDAAAVAVLRALLEVISGNLEGALAGADSEFLHQLRISVRRSRTVQRQLHTVFEPGLLPGYRTEFRWLQRATGEARDLDVYLEGFGDLQQLLPERWRDALEPLHMVLEHWRLAAHGDLARTLLSRRTAELLSDWEILLETLVELPTEERPGARRPIGELGGTRITHLYDRVVRIGETIDPLSPPTALHGLRKAGKELRYMLELFGAQVFSPEAVDPLLALLKPMQDVLGRYQDRIVQTDVLSAVADEVAGLPRGPRAVLAMGVLVDRLAQDRIQARREFVESFAELAAPERRQQITETFG